MKKNDSELRVLTQLRRAITKSGLSDNELARQAGVAQPVVTRFRNGTLGLSLSNAERIGNALGLKLTWARRPARKSRKRPLTPRRK